MKIDMPTTAPTQPVPPDWKISELYEKSFEIIKKNKVLWIFGMAFAGFSSGSSFNSVNWDNLPELLSKKEETSQLLPNVTNVLGATTDPASQLFTQLFSAIPVYLYVILGMAIVVIVIVSIIIGFVSNTWSNAALIQGIQIALDGKIVNIHDSSEKAFPSIKPLIRLSILTTLIFIGGVFAFSLPLLITMAINNTALTVIMVLLAILAVVPTILLFALAGIWAPRIIIFEQKPAWQAFKTGFKIARKKFWPSLGLGIVNNILALFIMGLPILIIGAVGVGLVLGTMYRTSLAVALVPIALVVVIVGILGFVLLSGILTAFSASVWTIAYNKIRGKYDK